MQHKEILTTIAHPDSTSCLEVALKTDPEGRRTLELRRLLWGEGVGWYSQQTLSLETEEAEQLLHGLRRGRRSWGGQFATSGEKVIPFPLISPGSSASSCPTSKKRGKRRGKAQAAISRA